MAEHASLAGQEALRRIRTFAIQLFACLSLIAMGMVGLTLYESGRYAEIFELQRAGSMLGQMEVDLHSLASPNSVLGQVIPIAGPSPKEKFESDTSTLRRLGQRPMVRAGIESALTKAEAVFGLCQTPNADRREVSIMFQSYGFASKQARAMIETRIEDLRRHMAETRGIARLALLAILVLMAKLAWFDNIVPLRRVLKRWQEDQESLELANRTLEQQAHQIELKTVELERMVDDMEVQMALHGHASRRFQSLFDGLPVGCLTFDMEGVVFEINPQMGKILGAPQHMFLLQDVCSVFGREAEQVEAFQMIVDQLGTTGNPINVEWAYTSPGSQKQLELHVLPLRNKEGAVVGGICSVLDVTHRKEYEEAIARSEARTRRLIENAPAAIALLDTDRKCLVATRAWLDSNGLDATDYQGKDLFELVNEAETHWGDAIAAGLAGQASEREEDIVIRHDGRIQWLSWSVIPWYLNEGEVGGVVMFQEDVTERREIEQRVRDSEERFDLAVRAASVGIWDWNLDRNQMYWSPRFAEILGLECGDGIVSHTELIGRIHPEDAQRFGESLHSHLKFRVPFSLEARFRHQAGHDVWLHIRGQAVWSGAGRPTRIVGAADDISVRKAYEIRVAESERRFRDVVEASGEYIWECDAEMRYTYLSDRFEAVLGAKCAEALGRQVTDFVSPQERSRLKSLFRDAAARGTGFVNVTVESETPRGTVYQRWNGVPVMSEDGHCVGFRGAGLDITFQRAAEEALFQATERTRGILEGIKDCFISLNSELEFTYVNSAAETELGNLGLALQGTPIWGAMPLEAHEPLRAGLAEANSSSGAHVFEVFFEDSKRWLEYRVSRGRDGYIVFFHDVTSEKESQRLIDEQMLQINEANFLLEVQQMELQEANSRLSHMAETDGLTKLFNRKKLNEVLDESVAVAVHGQPLGVIMMDVDFFKKYNDTFGHLAGDEVLKRVSLILQEVVGQTGVPARYGGEEFVVVCQNMTTSDVMNLAEEIRSSIETYPWELRSVTASMGVGMWAPGDTVQSLLETADAALYESKQAGRNQVTLGQQHPKAA